MASYNEVRDTLITSLDGEDELRERAYTLSRTLIRSCRRFISDLVSGRRPVSADSLIDTNSELIEMALDHKVARYSFVDDALVELAEAQITHALLTGGELPVPEEMVFEERHYALGLCDAAGELRRVFLDELIKGNIQEASKIHTMMIDLMGILDGMAYPSGLIPLKRKQDVLRSLVDKSSGELSMALYSGKKSVGR